MPGSVPPAIVGESGEAVPSSRRQTEVEDLDPSVAGDEDVFGLQIAVNDSLLVRSGEAVRDLDADLDRLARRHGATFQPLAKRFTFEQLGDGVGRALVKPDVVNGQDVRMRQRRDRPGFALEPRAPVGILCERRRKDFDGDVALEPGIARAIHLAHASCAKRLGHYVGTETGARGKATHVGCGWMLAETKENSKPGRACSMKIESPNSCV